MLIVQSALCHLNPTYLLVRMNLTTKKWFGRELFMTQLLSHKRELLQYSAGSGKHPDSAEETRKTSLLKHNFYKPLSRRRSGLSRQKASSVCGLFDCRFRDHKDEVTQSRKTGLSNTSLGFKADQMPKTLHRSSQYHESGFTVRVWEVITATIPRLD